MHPLPMQPPTLLILSLLVLSGLASKGDRARIFKDCVSDCSSRQCNGREALPSTLRFMRWTCVDVCNYDCMHEITTRDMKVGTSVKQYHGKWPFWRLGGVQEPASVAFSLLNLWGHVQGVRRLQNEVSSRHPMQRYYSIWAFTSMNTWVWSSVFHCRDTPLTEKMDYFSAAATILYGLYFSVIRLFHLYQDRKAKTRLIWTVTCALALISHITYLSLLPRFDYTYNIVSNSVIGLTHNFLWLIYALPSRMSVLSRFPNRPRQYRPRFVFKAAVLVLLTTAATGLEVFDFPPYKRVIDAHSLWHLSTALIAPHWYQFLVQDSNDEGWQVSGLKSQ
ncbi:Per1-like protein [Mucidula mucida]|nr:Per1-like protein [Mucidula mucida]